MIETYSYCRGHLVHSIGEVSRYDDGEPYDDSRICDHCAIPHTPYGPEACLGWIDGLISVCCGHGGVQSAIYMTTKRIGA